MTSIGGPCKDPLARNGLSDCSHYTRLLTQQADAQHTVTQAWDSHFGAPDQQRMMYQLFKALMLPPGIFVILGLCAILLHRQRPFLAMTLLWGSSLLLWALSTLLVGQYAMGLLEPARPLSQGQMDAFQPRAIVVLGADRNNSSPEYGGIDQPGRHLLPRLRYAATLHRQYSLPLLVSGGTGYYGRIAQAQVMADMLQQDYQTPVRWLEGESMTTWENATYSKTVLSRSGIDRVVLVTEAFHMRRAMASFAAAGLCVLPAPTFFMGPLQTPPTWRDLLPSIAGLELSVLALHEALGLLYYKMWFFDSKTLARKDDCPPL